ncbi:permease-like cell division protein FtsX [Microbacterium sp. No. 7]|uniref:permease-like cell division protein FtsX n=1 Tax=Microbacterium sp. No. 7 TaxID=1714373 RepID=UPI0006D18971|nr:permease-like cell division protein FtsX [Microbacterium sp. No. 7]ALJ20014.1 cell division protein FtsX [Microbacterium sp. No. 7]
MRLRLILAEALSGLRRNVSMVISVVLVTFVSLTFVGAAMLMQMQIGTMRAFWADRAQVEIWLCRDGAAETTCAGGVATEEQIAAVEERLGGSALQKVIRDHRFESRDEAYQKVLEIYGEDYVEFVTPEQLNETFYVNLYDPGNIAVIDEAFSGMDGVQQVRNQMQYLEPLFSALTVATYIAIGIAALMLIAAVLLISTTIRLSAYARRRELNIMRLVGASNPFIQTPFILEGVFAALLGSLLASGAILVGVRYGVGEYLKPRMDFVTTWIGVPEALTVLPFVIGIGVLLAAFSAGFAIRRWLRA